MLNNAFGLLYASDDNMRLKELTLQRTIASVPFGGRYRMIDFPLSNLVNSGVTSVAVLTQRNYSSLLDHIGTGDPWDLNRKSDGLRFLPPYATTENGYYRGTVDAFRAARDFLRHTSARYCIYSDCSSVFNEDFEGMMKQHQDTGADITLLYKRETPENDVFSDNFDALHFELDENKRVIDLEIGSLLPQSRDISLGCMLIDKQLLDYLVDDAFSRGFWDFTRDVLLRKYQSFRIYGYEHKGYATRMTSVESYFNANMELLKSEVRADLFDRERRIFTKVKDEVPALYKSSGSAKNVMVADGCIIEGHLENCVLSRGVHIHSGATVKNCIIMQGCEIQENAQLENCILDKDVIVRRGRRMVGQQNYPVVVRKGSVI